MTTRRNSRDPLTLRIPRTLAECRRDPWAYSEGAHEPQHLLGAPQWHPTHHYAPSVRGHRIVAWLCALGLLIIVPLIAIGIL